jgi:type 1 fimbria pilin
MSSKRIAVLCATLLLAATAVTAQAPANVRIRGTITAVDATSLSVKSRDGKDLRIALPETLNVSYPKAVRLEDIKEGDFVGTTTRAGPNGTEVAIEIHFLPPTANAGQTPYDLEPKSKMINARVQAKVMRTGDHEITLQYANDTQKVVVPQGTPIVRSVPGTRADLVVGEYVFVAAQPAADGALTALRVQVSKDGVRPPQ